MEGRMTDKASSTPAVDEHCWSCHGKIDPTDNYCRHCGVRLQQETSPNVDIHTRLVSIEKMLLKTAVGVALILLLIGWILLQTYHFGQGGFRGDLQTQKSSVTQNRGMPRSHL
jgi:hypothetical protein